MLITMAGCGSHADPSVAPSLPAPIPAATTTPTIIASPAQCVPMTAAAAKGAVAEQLCVTA